VLRASDRTLIGSNDVVNCAAAIDSMTALQQLTCLKFTPGTDLELLALVRACCVLEGHSLQELHVSEGDIRLSIEVVPPPATATWIQLVQLRQLRKLAVRIVSRTTHDALAAEAVVFLGALSGCKTVSLRLPSLTFVPFEDARAELSRVGWPVPCLTSSSA
jgi:hypothetical protein